MKPNQKMLLRVISVLVIQSFLIQQVSFAAPSVAPIKSTLFQKDSLHFKLPESIARIDEVHFTPTPKTDRLIYLFQDAHTNESGQINLAKALDIVLEQEGIQTVFTEAGYGDDSLSFIKQYGTPSIRKQVGLQYLRKGQIKGTEFLSFTSDHEFVLWGVEDKALYDKSIEAYRAVVKEREQSQRYLTKVRQTIEVLKPKLFNSALLAFDQKFQDFQANQLSLAEYFEVLNAEAKRSKLSLKSYPQLKALHRVYKKEAKLDFEAANREQIAAIQTLPKQDQALLNTAAQKQASLKVTQDLNQKRAFYALLQEKVQDFEAYPELKRYLAYLKAASKIDAKAVLIEKDKLERLVFKTLAKTSDEKQLVQAAKYQSILEDLFDMKLTPESYLSYQDDFEGFRIVDMAGFLNKKIMDLEKYYERVLFTEEAFEEVAKTAEVFYNLTTQRDRTFIDKALARMQATGESKAILVTGGYHTNNLKRLLESENISYVVVTPQVYHETDHKRYEKLLLSQTRVDEKLTQITQAKQAKESARTAMVQDTIHTIDGRLVLNAVVTRILEMARAPQAELAAAEALVSQKVIAASKRTGAEQTLALSGARIENLGINGREMNGDFRMASYSNTDFSAVLDSVDDGVSPIGDVVDLALNAAGLTASDVKHVSIIVDDRVIEGSYDELDQEGAGFSETYTPDVSISITTNVLEGVKRRSVALATVESPESGARGVKIKPLKRAIAASLSGIRVFPVESNKAKVASGYLVYTDLQTTTDDIPRGYTTQTTFYVGREEGRPSILERTIIVNPRIFDITTFRDEQLSEDSLTVTDAESGTTYKFDTAERVRPHWPPLLAYASAGYTEHEFLEISLQSRRDWIDGLQNASPESRLKQAITTLFHGMRLQQKLSGVDGHAFLVIDPATVDVEENGAFPDGFEEFDGEDRLYSGPTSVLDLAFDVNPTNFNAQAFVDYLRELLFQTAHGENGELSFSSEADEFEQRAQLFLEIFGVTGSRRSYVLQEIQDGRNLMQVVPVNRGETRGLRLENAKTAIRQAIEDGAIPEITFRVNPTDGNAIVVELIDWIKSEYDRDQIIAVGTILRPEQVELVADKVDILVSPTHLQGVFQKIKGIDSTRDDDNQIIYVPGVGSVEEARVLIEQSNYHPAFVKYFPGVLSGDTEQQRLLALHLSIRAAMPPELQLALDYRISNHRIQIQTPGYPATYRVYYEYLVTVPPDKKANLSVTVDHLMSSEENPMLTQGFVEVRDYLTANGGDNYIGLIPTGGINPENARVFMNSGAAALGASKNIAEIRAALSGARQSDIEEIVRAAEIIGDSIRTILDAEIDQKQLDETLSDYLRSIQDQIGVLYTALPELFFDERSPWFLNNKLRSIKILLKLLSERDSAKPLPYATEMNQIRSRLDQIRIILDRMVVREEARSFLREAMLIVGDARENSNVIPYLNPSVVSTMDEATDAWRSLRNDFITSSDLTDLERRVRVSALRLTPLIDGSALSDGRTKSSITSGEVQGRFQKAQEEIQKAVSVLQTYLDQPSGARWTQDTLRYELTGIGERFDSILAITPLSEGARDELEDAVIWLYELTDDLDTGDIRNPIQVARTLAMINKEIAQLDTLHRDLAGWPTSRIQDDIYGPIYALQKELEIHASSGARAVPGPGEIIPKILAKHYSKKLREHGFDVASSSSTSSANSFTLRRFDRSETPAVPETYEVAYGPVDIKNQPAQAFPGWTIKRIVGNGQPSEVVAEYGYTRDYTEVSANGTEDFTQHPGRSELLDIDVTDRGQLQISVAADVRTQLDPAGITVVTMSDPESTLRSQVTNNTLTLGAMRDLVLVSQSLGIPIRRTGEATYVIQLDSRPGDELVIEQVGEYAIKVLSRNSGFSASPGWILAPGLPKDFELNFDRENSGELSDFLADLNAYSVDVRSGSRVVKIGDRLNVYSDRSSMGRAAALQGIAEMKKLQDQLAPGEKMTIMFAAAPSQVETIEALVRLSVGVIDWTRVNITHMDEWVPEDPAQRVLETDEESFRYWLNKNLINPLIDAHGNLTSRDDLNIYFIDADNELTPKQIAKAYAKTLKDLGGVDGVFGGYGENGHKGFNDADQNSRKKSMKLYTTEKWALVVDPHADPVNREQQYGDYPRFKEEGRVPLAVTASLIAMATAKFFVDSVPGSAKQQALYNVHTRGGDASQNAEFTPFVPATFFNDFPADRIQVFTDEEGAAKIVRAQAAVKVLTHALFRRGSTNKALRQTAQDTLAEIFPNHRITSQSEEGAKTVRQKNDEPVITAHELALARELFVQIVENGNEEESEASVALLRSNLLSQTPTVEQLPLNPAGSRGFVYGGHVPVGQALPDEQVRQTITEGLASDNFLYGRRVLHIVPDNTRVLNLQLLLESTIPQIHHHNPGAKQDILLALGTHDDMSTAAISKMVVNEHLHETVARKFPGVNVFNHDWQGGVREIGRITAQEIVELSNGSVSADSPLARDVALTQNHLIDPSKYDVVVLYGDVQAHEVAGASNGGKMIYPGTSGEEFLGLFHLISAYESLEAVIGRKDTTARRLINRAIEPITEMGLDIRVINTVVEDNQFVGAWYGTLHNGAWDPAADLTLERNIVLHDHDYDLVIGQPKDNQFPSHWTGNKVKYRAGGIVAKGGKLVVFAPTIGEYSESLHAPHLMRMGGYHNKGWVDANWDTLTNNPDPSQNIPLAVIAHSIHGVAPGTLEDGQEQFDYEVVWSSGVSPADVEALNLSYVSPDVFEMELLLAKDPVAIKRVTDALGMPELNPDRVFVEYPAAKKLHLVAGSLGARQTSVTPAVSGARHASLSAQVVARDFKGANLSHKSSSEWVHTLTADRRIAEFSVDSNGKLHLHRLNIPGTYVPGQTPPSQYRTDNDEIDIDTEYGGHYITPEGQQWLIEWMNRHENVDVPESSVTRKPRMRVALDQTTLHYQLNNSHSHFLTADDEDNVVYIGERFLSFIVSSDGTKDPEAEYLRDELLDRHIFNETPTDEATIKLLEETGRALQKIFLWHSEALVNQVAKKLGIPIDDDTQVAFHVMNPTKLEGSKTFDTDTAAVRSIQDGEHGVNAVVLPLGLNDKHMHDIQEILAYVRANPRIMGLIPAAGFKDKLAPYLDEVDDIARILGVDPVYKDADGRLLGTMDLGISTVSWYQDEILKGAPVEGQNIVILGAGPTGRAIAYEFIQKGAASATLSDVDADRLQDVNAIKSALGEDGERLVRYHGTEHAREVNLAIRQADAVFNATDLGKEPDKLPYAPAVEYASAHEGQAWIDMNYRPHATLFLYKAAKYGYKFRTGVYNALSLTARINASHMWYFLQGTPYAETVQREDIDAAMHARWTEALSDAVIPAQGVFLDPDQQGPVPKWQTDGVSPNSLKRGRNLGFERVEGEWVDPVTKRKVPVNRIRHIEGYKPPEVGVTLKIVRTGQTSKSKDAEGGKFIRSGDMLAHGSSHLSSQGEQEAANAGFSLMKNGMGQKIQEGRVLFFYSPMNQSKLTLDKAFEAATSTSESALGQRFELIPTMATKRDGTEEVHAGAWSTLSLDRVEINSGVKEWQIAAAVVQDDAYGKATMPFIPGAGANSDRLNIHLPENTIDLIERARAFLKFLDQEYSGTGNEIVFFGNSRFLAALQVVMQPELFVDEPYIELEKHLPKRGDIYVLNSPTDSQQQDAVDLNVSGARIVLPEGRSAGPVRFLDAPSVRPKKTKTILVLGTGHVISRYLKIWLKKQAETYNIRVIFAGRSMTREAFDTFRQVNDLGVAQDDYLQMKDLPADIDDWDTHTATKRFPKPDGVWVATADDDHLNRVKWALGDKEKKIRVAVEKPLDRADRLPEFDQVKAENSDRILAIDHFRNNPVFDTVQKLLANDQIRAVLGEPTFVHARLLETNGVEYDPENNIDRRHLLNAGLGHDMVVHDGAASMGPMKALGLDLLSMKRFPQGPGERKTRPVVIDGETLVPALGTLTTKYDDPNFATDQDGNVLGRETYMRIAGEFEGTGVQFVWEGGKGVNPGTVHPITGEERQSEYSFSTHGTNGYLKVDFGADEPSGPVDPFISLISNDGVVVYEKVFTRSEEEFRRLTGYNGEITDGLEASHVLSSDQVTSVVEFSALEDIGYRGNLANFMALVQQDQLQEGEFPNQETLEFYYDSVSTPISYIEATAQEAETLFQGNYPSHAQGADPDSWVIHNPSARRAQFRVNGEDHAPARHMAQALYGEEVHMAQILKLLGLKPDEVQPTILVRQGTGETRKVSPLATIEFNADTYIDVARLLGARARYGYELDVNAAGQTVYRIYDHSTNSHVDVLPDQGFENSVFVHEGQVVGKNAFLMGPYVNRLDTEIPGPDGKPLNPLEAMRNVGAGHVGNEPYAIHGLLRNRPFRIEAIDETSHGIFIRGSVVLGGPQDPIIDKAGIVRRLWGHVRYEVIYQLQAGHLRTTITPTNLGNAVAHIGLGVHSWYVADEHSILTSPTEAFYDVREFPGDLIPTELYPVKGPAPRDINVGKDLSEGIELGDTFFDTVYELATDADHAFAHTTLVNPTIGRKITIEQQLSELPNLTVFTGKLRELGLIAIQPGTSPTNARARRLEREEVKLIPLEIALEPRESRSISFDTFVEVIGARATAENLRQASTLLQRVRKDLAGRNDAQIRQMATSVRSVMHTNPLGFAENLLGKAVASDDPDRYNTVYVLSIVINFLDRLYQEQSKTFDPDSMRSDLTRITQLLDQVYEILGKYIELARSKDDIYAANDVFGQNEFTIGSLQNMRVRMTNDVKSALMQLQVPLGSRRQSESLAFPGERIEADGPQVRIVNNTNRVLQINEHTSGARLEQFVLAIENADISDYEALGILREMLPDLKSKKTPSEAGRQKWHHKSSAVARLLGVNGGFSQIKSAYQNALKTPRKMTFSPGTWLGSNAGTISSAISARRGELKRGAQAPIKSVLKSGVPLDNASAILTLGERASTSDHLTNPDPEALAFWKKVFKTRDDQTLRLIFRVADMEQKLKARHQKLDPTRRQVGQIVEAVLTQLTQADNYDLLRYIQAMRDDRLGAVSSLIQTEENLQLLVSLIEPDKAIAICQKAGFVVPAEDPKTQLMTLMKVAIAPTAYEIYLEKLRLQIQREHGLPIYVDARPREFMARVFVLKPEDQQLRDVQEKALKPLLTTSKLGASVRINNTPAIGDFAGEWANGLVTGFQLPIIFQSNPSDPLYALRNIDQVNIVHLQYNGAVPFITRNDKQAVLQVVGTDQATVARAATAVLKAIYDKLSKSEVDLESVAQGVQPLRFGYVEVHWPNPDAGARAPETDHVLKAIAAVTYDDYEALDLFESVAQGGDTNKITAKIPIADDSGKKALPGRPTPRKYKYKILGNNTGLMALARVMINAAESPDVFQPAAPAVVEEGAEAAAVEKPKDQRELLQDVLDRATAQGSARKEIQLAIDTRRQQIAAEIQDSVLKAQLPLLHAVGMLRFAAEVYAPESQTKAASEYAKPWEKVLSQSGPDLVRRHLRIANVPLQIEARRATLREAMSNAKPIVQAGLGQLKEAQNLPALEVADQIIDGQISNEDLKQDATKRATWEKLVKAVRSLEIYQDFATQGYTAGNFSALQAILRGVEVQDELLQFISETKTALGLDAPSTGETPEIDDDDVVNWLSDDPDGARGTQEDTLSIGTYAQRFQLRVGFERSIRVGEHVYTLRLNADGAPYLALPGQEIAIARGGTVLESERGKLKVDDEATSADAIEFTGSVEISVPPVSASARIVPLEVHNKTDHDIHVRDLTQDPSAREVSGARRSEEEGAPFETLSANTQPYFILSSGNTKYLDVNNARFRLRGDNGQIFLELGEGDDLMSIEIPGSGTIVEITQKDGYLRVNGKATRFPVQAFEGTVEVNRQYVYGRPLRVGSLSFSVSNSERSDALVRVSNAVRTPEGARIVTFTRTLAASLMLFFVGVAHAQPTVAYEKSIPLMLQPTAASATKTYEFNLERTSVQGTPQVKVTSAGVQSFDYDPRQARERAIATDSSGLTASDLMMQDRALEASVSASGIAGSNLDTPKLYRVHTGILGLDISDSDQLKAFEYQTQIAVARLGAKPQDYVRFVGADNYVAAASRASLSQRGLASSVIQTDADSQALSSLYRDLITVEITTPETAPVAGHVHIPVEPAQDVTEVFFMGPMSDFAIQVASVDYNDRSQVEAVQPLWSRFAGRVVSADEIQLVLTGARSRAQRLQAAWRPHAIIERLGQYLSYLLQRTRQLVTSA